MKGTPAQSLGRIGRAAVNAALAAILAIGLLPSWSIGGGKAYADTGSVWVSNNGSEVYDGYNTNFFTVNGQVAWCSQPNLGTPAGSYSYWTVRGDTSTAWTAFAIAMLYADTSSIFDNDPRVGRPLTSLDNNPVKDGVGWYLDRIRDSHNNDDSWYTRSHVIISYAANEAMSGWCDPFKGCTNRGDWEAQCSEFWNACWTIASGGCLPGVSQAECDELRAVAQTSEVAFTNASGIQSVSWLAKVGVGYGAIDLSKASDDASITDGNPMYDLSGARYGIYRSWNDAGSRASEAASMTTDGGGYAWCGRLSAGTYYVRETAAPAGYLLDDAIYEVRVNAGSTARVNGDQVRDEVASLNGGPVLAKYDAEGAYVEGGNQPQGDASLALAEYTIKYYAADDASGAPTRTWVLRTDETGQIDLAKAKDSFELDGQTYGYKASGDDFYESRGSVCLPLGTVTVQETRAPQGYLLPDPAPTRVGHIKQGHASSIIWEDGKAVQDENTDAVKQADGETVVRCGLSVDKSDFETKDYAALGGAKLDGAVFEVVNKSKRDVRVGGVLYGNGEVVAELTVAGGRATTDADGDGVDRTLPYGTYTVRETITGEGYSISEDVVDVTIDDFASDGEVIEKKRADGAGIENKVKRGDVELTKADASTGKRLAGVAFSITSDTTGESHIAVTDGNGYFSSSAANHSDKTNANDSAVTYADGEAVVDSSKLDANAGVWFGAWGDGNTTDAEDSLGALPWDTYTVRELRCDGNSGLQLVSDIKLVVSKDKVSVTLGTIDDTVPTVSTTAFVGEIGNKKLTADAEAVELSDRVAYAGVVPGFEYTVRGTVYDKSTGAPLLVGGKKVSAEKTFNPEGTSGQVELSFALEDTSAIADGAKLVVYEDLYQGREKVASHADISDSEQTVTVARPKIGTTARDGESATHDAARDTEMRVVDTVSYKGCIPGREYKAAGKLVDKATGEAVRDAKGAEVVAETTFTPEAADGSVEVVFAFDGSNLAEGVQMVAFETLSRSGREMAAHEDATDAGQTVTVIKPCLRTTALDAVDGDKVVASDPEACVVDKVAFANAAVGKAYRVVGELVELQADGQPGRAVARGEAVFTAEKSAGEVEVRFDVDATELVGKKLVVFERLYRGETLICEHAQADDADQTIDEVRKPEIATVAADVVDGDKAAVADRSLKISDEVRLSGIVPGKEYTLRASVIVLAPVAGDDGEASGWEKVGEVDGAPMGETTFKADAAECTQKVELTVPALALEGCKLVVTERLYRGKTEVADHVSEDDADQTIEVTSSRIGTTATDGLDGDKNVVADFRAKVVDAIAYENVVPGVEHTAAGLLMDKATCAPLLAGIEDDDQEGELASQARDLAEMLARALDGEEAEADDDAEDDGIGEEAAREELATAFAAAHKTGEIDLAALKAQVAEAFPDLAGHLVWSETVFTPDAADGEVEVAFDFDASRWLQTAGCEATAFEMLVRDGQLAAVHADIDDADQTVAIVPPEIGTELVDATDGDHALQPSTTAKLTDTVSYENLIPGKSYKLSGKLMDKETGEAVLVNGAEVTAEAELTPEEASGTAEVVFEFDSTGLSGKSLVCFERLDKEGLEVAVHADIDDDAQTVTVEEPGAPVDETGGEAYDDTGAAIGYAAAGAAALAAAGAGSIAWGLRRRRKGEAEKEA